MTTQNYVENIKSIFPEVKEAQIVRDLDSAQKLFAEETKLLTTRGQLSSPNSNVAWNLPSDFASLTDVVLYDSNGEPQYLSGTVSGGSSTYNYAFEIEFGKFYIYSRSRTAITGLDVDTAYIHYIKLPTTLVDRTTALEIDLQFRDAIESYVLGKYFGRYTVEIAMQTNDGVASRRIRDLNSAKFHLGEYERLKIKAKRFVGKKRKVGDAQYYQHAGKFEIPRRTNDVSAGSTTTTQISALSDLYTKYVSYTVSSAGSPTATETISQVGYSTVSGAVAGNTFTLSSTAEFGDDTMILSNNDNVTWAFNSSSEIVFTLPVGWGVIALEIYERT